MAMFLPKFRALYWLQTLAEGRRSSTPDQAAYKTIALIVRLHPAVVILRAAILRHPFRLNDQKK